MTVFDGLFCHPSFHVSAVINRTLSVYKMKSSTVFLLLCAVLLISFDSVRWAVYVFLFLASCMIGFCYGLMLKLFSDEMSKLSRSSSTSAFHAFSKRITKQQQANVDEPVRRAIVLTNNLDAAIQELMELVVRDYALSWYSQLSSDTVQFANVIQNELWVAIENFSIRLQNLDKTAFLSQNFVNAISNHLSNLQQANQRYDATGHRVSPVALHSCLRSDASELEYIRNVAEVFIVHLLPKPYSRLLCTRHLLREILACKVFKPAVDLVTDPHYLNNTLYNWLLYRDQLQAEHKRTYTYASTYEQFMSIIKRCADLEVLKHIRLNIISEIMLSTTLQNIKRSQGIETDKSLSPKGSEKGELLHARNLPKYINQLKVAKSACEKQIHELGGVEYLSYVEEKQLLEKIPGKKVLSFELIMNSQMMRSSLTSFLKKSQKHCLVRYWEKVDVMKKSTRSEQYICANHIYEEFLSQKLNPVFQILDGAIIKSMKSYMSGDEGPEGFWESQSAVYRTLEQQHYGSFISSDIYHRHISEMDDLETLPDLTDSCGQSPVTSEPISTMDSQDIALHSTYAHEKMLLLNERILKKSEALQAMELLQKKDPETRKLQDNMARELESLIHKQKQLEFHIEQTDLWIRHLGMWKVCISDADVVESDDRLMAVFVLLVNLVGISKKSTFQQSPTVSGSSVAWIVTRKLEDFEQLHRKLVQIVPSIRSYKFPSRSISQTAASLKKAREKLQLYLNNVLEDDVLAQSEPVFAFLSKSLDLLQQSTSVSELTNNRTAFSMTDIFKRMAVSLERLASSKPPAAESDKEAEMDATARPLYNLIANVFELKGFLNWLPRTLVAIVQATYGKSIKRKIHETVEWIVSGPMLVYYVHLFRDAYWPNGQMVGQSPQPSDEEKRRIRILAEAKLLEYIPATVKNLFGEEKARRGVVKVFEAFQDCRLNKHLFYIVLEMFLKETFMELKSFEFSDHVRDFCKRNLEGT